MLIDKPGRYEDGTGRVVPVFCAGVTKWGARTVVARGLDDEMVAYFEDGTRPDGFTLERDLVRYLGPLEPGDDGFGGEA